MTKVRAVLTIAGRVQGVFYRQSTKNTADQLGLTGWVKNCREGSVEAIFEGDQEIVEAAIEWCWQGPPSAQVVDITIKWHDFQDEFSDFKVLR